MTGKYIHLGYISWKGQYALLVLFFLLTKVCSLVDNQQIDNLMVKEYFHHDHFHQDHFTDVSFFDHADGKLVFYSEHKTLLSKLKET